MPLEGTMDAFVGGAFDADGSFIKDSVVHRGSAPELREPEEELKGRYIYGGCLFAHFGHFIWESHARISTFQKCRPYPILFISPNDRLFNTQKLFFKNLGIKNEILLIKHPTRVSNLIYSSPGASLSPLSMSDEMLNALSIKNFEARTDKKIWLSRSKLKYGRVLNEPYIEERVKALGFDIIYPEKIPLPEQIRLIASSSVVAGFSGSQFFSAFFAKKTLGEFKIFNRRARVPDTMPFLLERKKINGDIVYFGVEDFGEEAPEKDRISLEPDKIVQTLEELA